MELKFRVNNFAKIKKNIKKVKAKFSGKFTEYYVYLKSGKKLQKTKGKFYLITIKKRKNFFELKYKKIDKKTYSSILNNSEIKRKLVNKRIIYKLGKVKISFNKMKVGKFVILDGHQKYISALAKKFGFRNPVTKPFSDL